MFPEPSFSSPSGRVSSSWPERMIDSVAPDEYPEEAASIFRFHFSMRALRLMPYQRMLVVNAVVTVVAGVLFSVFGGPLTTLAGVLATITGGLLVQIGLHHLNMKLTLTTAVEHQFEHEFGQTTLATLKQLEGVPAYQAWRKRESLLTREALTVLMTDQSKLSINEAVHAARALGAS